jgi:hypothetical protein
MFETHFFSVDVASCLAVMQSETSDTNTASLTKMKTEKRYEASMRIKLRYETQWPPKTSKTLFFILCTFIDECIAREEGESWMHQSLQMHYFNELNAGDRLISMAESNLFQDDQDPIISDALMIITSLGYQGALNKNPELKKKIEANAQNNNPKIPHKPWWKNTNILSMIAVLGTLASCAAYRAMDIKQSKTYIAHHGKQEVNLEK